jgi:hypothetical protein
MSWGSAFGEIFLLLFEKIIESRLRAQFYHMLSKLAPRLNKVDIKIESYWILNKKKPGDNVGGQSRY